MFQALLISKREIFLRSVWNESQNNVNYREVNLFFLFDFSIITKDRKGIGFEKYAKCTKIRPVIT